MVLVLVLVEQARNGLEHEWLVLGTLEVSSGFGHVVQLD